MYRMLSAVVLMFLLCQAAFAQFLGFEPNYPMDTIAVNGENFFEPYLRRGNNPGEIFCLIRKREPGKKYYFRILYSSDYGQNWTLQPGRINTSLTALPEPGMDFVIGPDNEICVIFAMETNSSNSWNLFFSKSQDLGVTWSPNITVGDTLEKQWRPAIALDGNNNLIVVYSSYLHDPYYKNVMKSCYSDDGGETWHHGGVVNDSVNYKNAQFVDIAAENGKVYAMWDGNREFPDSDSMDICFSVSSDTGKTWSPQVRVNDSRINNRSNPNMVVHDGNIYAVWHDKRNDGPPYGLSEQGDIFFSSSADGGQTWLPNRQVNRKKTGMQTHGFILCDPNGVLHVLYVDDVLLGSWNFDLYYTYSMDFGNTWETAIRVDDSNVGVQRVPSAIIDDTGTLCVAWEDDRTQYQMNEIYFTRSANSITSIDRGREQVVQKAGLSAYPNPFNPVTTITYRLPQAARVTLKIYNTLGQEVAVLVNARQEAGRHQLQYDASQLPGGIYFYTLRFGTQALTRRMILMK